MLTLITLEVITGHCFGKGVGTALCPCQALGKPWDGLCASRTCWDSVVLVAGNADWAGTHHQAAEGFPPEGWETGQAALPAQPPGLSPEVGLIKASFSWRCGWYCSRAKAGKSHSPIRALVPCGAMLIRRKSGGTKRQQEDGDTSHWSCLLGQKHCEHLEAADFL